MKHIVLEVPGRGRSCAQAAVRASRGGTDEALRIAFVTPTGLSMGSRRAPVVDAAAGTSSAIGVPL